MRNRFLHITFILIPMLFVLTGCLQTDIEIGIDKSYNAFISYNFKLDVTEIDPQYHDVMANTLNNLGWHYQEEFGFTASVSTDSDIYLLAMRKIIPNDNFSDAFNSLKNMLTDERITPFVSVDMVLENFPRQDSYVLGAATDISRIIETSGASDLPPDLRQMLEQGLDTSSGTILLTMPVSELVDASPAPDIHQNLATMIVPVNYTGKSDFEIRAKVFYSKDGQQLRSADLITQELTQTRQITVIVCLSVLAVLLTVLIINLLRRRKKQEF